MSSYLNIYGVLRDTGNKIELISFSRNHSVYQELTENLSIAHVGNEETYTKLDEFNISDALNSIQSSISNTENRIIEYEKHAGGNIEIINDIIEFKEYVKELKSTAEYLNFIKELINNTTYGWDNTFEKIVCNIS